MTTRPLPSRPDPSRLVLDEGFDGDALDEQTWTPHYLPAWSSRARTRATHHVTGSWLHLTIGADQPLWCGGEHRPDMRVSGVQSASWSGPRGSTRGQQPFRDGQVVAEEQDLFVGHLFGGGYVEVRARMHLDATSMAAFWLVGLEDRPERSAEICVAEVFGNAIDDAGAAVGTGVHAFRDPTAREDFAAVRVAIDVAEPHDYAVDRTRDRAVFLVDDQVVREVAAPPAYPMQAMLAVFEFPEAADRPTTAPVLVVDHVRAWA